MEGITGKILRDLTNDLDKRLERYEIMDINTYYEGRKLKLKIDLDYFVSGLSNKWINREYIYEIKDNESLKYEKSTFIKRIGD